MSFLNNIITEFDIALKTLSNKKPGTDRPYPAEPVVFGVSPPTPDWGLMISNARGLMSFAWWAVIAPIVGLSSLIIGINLTADAFAKALGIDRSTKAPV